MSNTEADGAAPKAELFDRVAAILGIAALSPFMALIAALIKLDSRGPVLFTQERIGHKGKPFKMYKFRTMTANASEEWHPPQRVNDFSTFVFHSIWPDKRVTRLGRILRNSSLDELPQLMNVARGDMRLVGPRPDEPYLVEQYRPDFHRRHDVKPGITGLAQVNGRSDLTYSQMMAYDLQYVDHHPFRRDLSILARTLAVVLRKEGAR
ncbi:MAG TPA: sugar transferase [Dehalococcoidia bacterium]|nr:sugar transferase [Dehalococcoidia bacterium]